MKQPKGFTEYGKDGCCPQEWDHTPMMTGHYEMDGSIQRCKNKEAHAKLKDHLCGAAGSHGQNAYTPNTGYGRGGTDY